MARSLALEISSAIQWDVLGPVWRKDAALLNTYADAVDAMTQPTRIEYETQEWESKQ